MNSETVTSFKPELDATDLRILELLQHDASQSNQDLAAAAHTSAATCLRRVKRMLDAGIIERRVAVLSPERLGAGLTVITEVTLDRQGAEHLAAFEQRAIAESSVQQCYRLSPGPDLMPVMQVAAMAAWNAVVERLFTQDANVRNVKSFFSVRRAKWQCQIALPKVSPTR